jgi:hypothetical protein
MAETDAAIAKEAVAVAARLVIGYLLSEGRTREWDVGMDEEGTLASRISNSAAI